MLTDYSFEDTYFPIVSPEEGPCGQPSLYLPLFLAQGYLYRAHNNRGEPAEFLPPADSPLQRPVSLEQHVVMSPCPVFTLDR